MIEFEGKQIPQTLEEVVDPKRTVLLVWDMQNDQAGRSFNKEEFLRTTPPLIAAAKKRFGYFSLDNAKVGRHQEYLKAPFQQQFSLGGALQLRAIAMMMLEGCVPALGNEAVCDSSFSTFRDWIRAGVDDFEKFVKGSRRDSVHLCNHDYRDIVWGQLPSLPDAPFQQRLFVVTGPSVGGAWAAVELFGHARFSAVLSSDPGLPEATWGYLVDPVGGKEEQDASFLTSTTVEEVGAPPMELTDVEAAMQKLMASVQELQTQQLISDMTDSAMREMLPAEGEVVTQEHIDRLSTKIAEDFVRSMFKTDRVEYLSLEDLLGPVHEGNESEE